MQPGEPMANGGDDTAKLPKPESPEWSRWKHMCVAIDKRYQSDKAEFTTYIHKNGVMVKEPIILFKRLMGKIEMGSLDDSIMGYFHLFAHQYAQADRLYDVFNEEQMEYAAGITRIMFNLKHFGCKRHVPFNKLQYDAYDSHWRSDDIAEFVEELDKYNLEAPPLTYEEISNQETESHFWSILEDYTA
jgi:hypothetical protein